MRDRIQEPTQARRHRERRRGSAPDRAGTPRALAPDPVLVLLLGSKSLIFQTTVSQWQLLIFRLALVEKATKHALRPQAKHCGGSSDLRLTALTLEADMFTATLLLLPYLPQCDGTGPW